MVRHVSVLAGVLLTTSLGEADRALALTAALGGRVTIEAEGAPLSQVLGQLEEQTGARIYNPLRNVPQEPEVTVEARGAPLRAVLREIALQCGCYVQTLGRTRYALRKGEDPRELAPTARAGPYALRLRSIRANDSMTLDFMATDDQPLRLDRGTTLNTEIEADDDLDLARIYGLHPAVRAVDDRGHEVPAKRTELPEPYEPPYYSSHEPWTSLRVELVLPDREAKALASVEGDLLVYREARYAQLVLSLDDPQATATDAGHTLRLIQARAGPEQRYTVRANLTAPPDEAPGAQPRRSLRPPQAEVFVQTAEGALVSPHSTSTRGGPHTPEQMTWQYEWGFGVEADQTPERLVYAFVVTGRELEALHYRLEDVGLPSWQD